MRLVRFQRYRRTALGTLLPDGRIVDLPAAAAAWLFREQHDPFWEQEVDLRLPNDVGKFLAGGNPSLALAHAALDFAQSAPGIEGIGGEPLFITSAEARLLAPLIPPLILASGARLDEGSDSREATARHREFFMRDPFNNLGPGDDIQLPTWLSRNFDVSPRLVAVVGHRLRDASTTEAADGIFGFCPAIEICARDLQTISWAGSLFHVQYPHARAFDGSLLFGGPVISKDEIGEIEGRSARIEIEGRTAVEAPLAWTVDDLVEWICRLSRIVTLEPGTLLILGSADDIAFRSARSGSRPVELIDSSQPQDNLIQAGARLRLTIEGVDSFTATVRHLAREDSRVRA